jgi:hypothetical protein
MPGTASKCSPGNGSRQAHLYHHWVHQWATAGCDGSRPRQQHTFHLSLPPEPGPPLPPGGGGGAAVIDQQWLINISHNQSAPDSFRSPLPLQVLVCQDSTGIVMAAQMLQTSCNSHLLPLLSEASIHNYPPSQPITDWLFTVVAGLRPYFPASGRARGGGGWGSDPGTADLAVFSVSNVAAAAAAAAAAAGLV